MVHKEFYLRFTCSLLHFAPKRHVLFKKYVQITILSYDLFKSKQIRIDRLILLIL